MHSVCIGFACSLRKNNIGGILTNLLAWLGYNPSTPAMKRPGASTAMGKVILKTSQHRTKSKVKKN
jgi:hypothetical protein